MCKEEIKEIENRRTKTPTKLLPTSKKSNKKKSACKSKDGKKIKIKEHNEKVQYLYICI